MTSLAIAFLVLAAVLFAVSILRWRSDGSSLLTGALLNASLGGFILAPSGWPRYVLVATFLTVFVWSMAGTSRAVFARYRWGLLLVGAAGAGILMVTFLPALVAGNEKLARNVTGIIAVAGLATLAYHSIQDLREGAKQEQ